MSELPSGDPFSRLVPVTQEDATALPTGQGGDPFDSLIPAEPEQDPFSSLVQVPQEEAANAVKQLGPVAELKWLDDRNKNLEILPKDDWKRRDELIGKLGMWDRMYERNISGVGDALVGLGKTIGAATGEIWDNLKGAKEDPVKTLMKIQATSVEGALRGTLDLSDIGEAAIKHLAGALDVYVLGAADTDKQTEDLHYEHYVERQQSRINRANINKDTVLGTLAGGAEIAVTGKATQGVSTQQELSKLVMPAAADVGAIVLSPANALPISAGGRVGMMLSSGAARAGAATAGKVALTAGMLNRTLNFGTRAEALIARAMPNLSQTAVKRTASALSGSAWTGATYIAGDVLEDLTGNDILKNISYIYGASRIGLASTAVGAGALQAILAQTAQGPRVFSALQRLSRTPGTPTVTTALARILDPLVTPVARTVRAGVGGAAVGAGFNVGIGLATGQEMPELAGAAAVGTAIGFPLGMIGHGAQVLSGADRAKRYMQEVAITRETQRALNGDAAAERFEQMPMNDQLGVGMIQAVVGPTGLIEVLDAAEFSKRYGTSAGVHVDNKTPGVLPRIVINADAKRPAGQTVLHEFGHELARQIAPGEIKALFDEFATPEEKKDFADEYVTRTVETKRKAGELPDVPGVAEFGKQMADVSKQLDESQPGWLEQEWFAEKSVQAFYGANWKDVLGKGDKADVAKWATLSLRSKRAVLENAGVAFDHAGKVIEPDFISESFKGQGDEQLTKILFQYMKERAEYSPVLDASVDHNARADAGKGPVIDFGRTFQRLKTHPAFKGTYEPNPRTGLMENEFSVQMPDGSIVLKSEKDVRAREKAEAAEMQKVFATPPVDPDSPLVGPRRILDDNGQASLQVSGQELPKSYYDSTAIPVRQKTKARAVQDVMMDGKGETIDMLYHQIGSEGGRASWATAVKQKLGNVRATFRTVRPINFFVSKANNLLARVVDVTAYNAKLLRAAEEATLAEWHNNAEVFDADVKKVMSNWATGVPGSTGLEAAKFIRIMDFLGKEGGRNSLIKSFRIDRMEDVRPTGRGGWTFDYGKFKTRSAPSPSPSPGPDVTVRPSPDVPGRVGKEAAAKQQAEVTEAARKAGFTIGPVFRGEHGEAEAGQWHTRQGAISFGTQEAAKTYAESPNVRADVVKKPTQHRAYLKIEKPFINDVDDPFVGVDTILTAFSEKQVRDMLRDPEIVRSIENTNNWHERLEPRGYDTVAELADRGSLEDLKDVYFDAYKLFDDPKYVKVLRDAGFDGAIHGGMGETALEAEYKIFSPEQAKLAEPVTRDDAGNVIPPSQRFDTTSRDYRYSPDVIKRELGKNAKFAVPPSDLVAQEALVAAHGDGEKAAKFGAARDTKPGTPVGVRIDIPAFRKTGDYVQVVHEKAAKQRLEGQGGRVGKVIGYDTHVVLEGPGKFFVNEGVAEKIKLGESTKVPIATAEGKYAADQTIPQDLGDWTAAGFDPVDHSFYYDKATDQMITGWRGKPGEPAAYSVGNTVFLKDPIYASAAKRAAARYSPDVTNEGSGRQTTGNPEFYSSLHETLDKKIQGRAAQPDQVMGMVRAPGSGVKAEEIKWSGLEQAVERIARENGGKVPKDQLMAYLRGEGAMKFKERRYEAETLLERQGQRGDYIQRQDLARRLDERSDALFREEMAGKVVKDDYGWFAKAADQLRAGDVTRARLHLANAERTPFIESVMADFDKIRMPSLRPKYEGYTVTGGENYREVVVGMPVPEDRVVYSGPSKEAAYKAGRESGESFAVAAPPFDGSSPNWTATISAKGEAFKSQHFPEEPNYLAHYRANERPDSSGSPGLFVEEFQSDRHQAGRKEGYKGEKPTGGVADAPFRKAEAWAPMLFRRALRDAVEAGKEWIGWTTGKTQNARYDLSRHVSEIQIGRDEDGFYYTAKERPDELHEGSSFERDKLSQADLAEHLGEGLAKRAAAELQVGAGPKRYAGQDLQLGGEGMKGFYDQMLVKEIGRYVKQWGAKVEKGSIPEGPRSEGVSGEQVMYSLGMAQAEHQGFWSNLTQQTRDRLIADYRAKLPADLPIWQVQITPEMAKGVKAGRQPLFSPDVTPSKSTQERLLSRRATQHRIDSSLAEAPLNTGAEARVVLQSPEAQAGIAAEGGYPQPGIVPHAAARGEAQRLVAKARDEGFLWSSDADQQLTAEFGRPGGGAEHDVWIQAEGDPVVIRSRTVHADEAYLPADTSPSLYLKRLEDFNTLFPEIAIEVIGVSTDKNGNTKVWTAQPFVEGQEFKNYAAMGVAMGKEGWKPLGSATVFKHAETGAIIEDVHLGNVLHDEGHVYPIDVIPTSLGSLEPTTMRASPDVGVGRHTLGAERETRVVGEAEAARLTRAERKAIREETKSATPKESAAKAAVLEESIRETKARFPVEDGWKGPLEFTGLDPAGKPVYKDMPYEFNRGRKGKPLKKGSKQYQTEVTALGSRMRDTVRTIFDRAQAGNEAAQKILSQASWYRQMRTRLRREFGGLGDLFADLLGATSPNTPVRTNWNFATDSMRRALRGDFDDLIPHWEKWADDVDMLREDLRSYVTEQLGAGRTKVSLTGKGEVKNKKTGKVTPALAGDATYLAKLEALNDRYKLGDAMLPTQESGARYGFNGRNVVRAMVDLWRTVRAPEPIMGEKGTAPKALNFSGNLIGFRPGATIDVWAARMLQRLAGKFRIPIPAEGAVTGRMLPSGETTHAFGMGQDVFAHATELIRGDPTLSTHETLKNLNPDDLQAIVWFVEKELWTRNNWTSQEGGSFEFEADLAGIANQTRVRELRRVIDSEASTPAAKTEALAELDTMKREVDRFVGGLAIERSAGLQGEAYVPTNADQARTSEQLHTAVYQSDAGNNVIGVKAASTEGRYGAVERSIDLEVVAREGYDPNPLWDQMREIADREKQDSTFLARILRSEEKADPLFHRAGVEIFFRTSKTGEAMEAAIQKLHDMGAGFHTIVVDARPTTKAKAGEMPPAVGVRILRLPEYDVRFDIDQSWNKLTDAEMAKRVRESHKELDVLARELMVKNPDVNLANAGYYEVRTEFAHEYAGIQPNRPAAGTPGSPRQAVWRGRPIREAIDAANIRHEADPGEP